MAYQIAETHAYRGETDAAFEWLDRALIQRDAGLTYLQNDPLMANIHADVRWDEILTRLGLADNGVHERQP